MYREYWENWNIKYFLFSSFSILGKCVLSIPLYYVIENLFIFPAASSEADLGIECNNQKGQG